MNTNNLFFNQADDGRHYWVIDIPKDGNVVVSSIMDYNGNRQEKVAIEYPLEKWKLLVDCMEMEFNRNYNEDNKTRKKFKTGRNNVGRLIGKEIMVLLWGTEGCDNHTIQKAITNWLGFEPEERWWLYTNTNAATGGILDRDRGWRKALKYILCENPIDDDGKEV